MRDGAREEKHEAVSAERASCPPPPFTCIPRAHCSIEHWEPQRRVGQLGIVVDASVNPGTAAVRCSRSQVCAAGGGAAAQRAIPKHEVAPVCLHRRAPRLQHQRVCRCTGHIVGLNLAGHVGARQVLDGHKLVAARRAHALAVARVYRDACQGVEALGIGRVQQDRDLCAEGPAEGRLR